MPSNIEFKARLNDRAAAEERARLLPAEFAGSFQQTDTYFNVGCGRLKLREVVNGGAELIYYRREESSVHRHCSYTVTVVHDPASLKEMLETSIGVRARVEKTRVVYMYGLTRIHFDEVQGLGTFLEVEVPEGTSEEEPKRIARFISKRFRIAEEDFIRTSYEDLVRGEGNGMTERDKVQEVG